MTRLSSVFRLLIFAVRIRITTKNISALNAVFYSEGVCSNAQAHGKEDNLIIETSPSGDLIFFSGKPGKDGRLFDLPKSDNDDSAAVAFD